MFFVRPDDALSTYRYLRVALVALVVFLGSSVIDTRRSATCWQSSISAYFYTTSHAVFVASLCAIGACLIIYQGSTRTEDMLLNFAGVLAFAVALAPTKSPVPCGPGLPTPLDPNVGVGNNIRALLVAIAVGAALYSLLRWKCPDPPRGEFGRSSAVGPRRFGGAIRIAVAAAATLVSWFETALPYVLGIFLVGYFGSFATDWSFFIKQRHNIAAIAMFVAIIAVVMHYAAYAAARRAADNRRVVYVVLYLAVAVVMAATLVLAIVLEFWEHPLGVLLVEAALIGAFGLFWTVQSFDLWNDEKYHVGSLGELLRALTAAPPT